TCINSRPGIWRSRETAIVGATATKRMVHNAPLIETAGSAIYMLAGTGLISAKNGSVFHLGHILGKLRQVKIISVGSRFHSVGSYRQTGSSTSYITDI